jgi:hypothetical protein
MYLASQASRPDGVNSCNAQASASTLTQGAELGWYLLMADTQTIAGTRHIQPFAEQQAAGFLQAQLFLMLQRTHGRHCLETMMQCRTAQIGYAIEQPDDVDVSEIVVRPTASPH